MGYSGWFQKIQDTRLIREKKYPAPFWFFFKCIHIRGTKIFSRDVLARVLQERISLGYGDCLASLIQFTKTAMERQEQNAASG